MFEYKELHFTADEVKKGGKSFVIKKLNNLGLDGWEVIHTEIVSNAWSGFTGTWFLLKRSIPELNNQSN